MRRRGPVALFPVPDACADRFRGRLSVSGEQRPFLKPRHHLTLLPESATLLAAVKAKPSGLANASALTAASARRPTYPQVGSEGMASYQSHQKDRVLAK